MRLSPHFTLAEFTRSRAAQLHHLANDPAENAVRNLRRLCFTVLEPLRSILGGYPLRVSSGYRDPLVNELVGGVPGSDHLYGRAADIWSAEHDAVSIARAVVDFALPVDQVIYEYGLWVHVSVPDDPYSQPAYEALTYRKVVADSGDAADEVLVGIQTIETENA